MATDKEHAHKLLDRLDSRQVAAVVHLLETMVNPLDLAPVEDEDLTPQTVAAVDRTRASLARGEGIPHEDIRREFGLEK
jgi:hypothetical protein